MAGWLKPSDELIPKATEENGKRTNNSSPNHNKHKAVDSILAMAVEGSAIYN